MKGRDDLEILENVLEQTVEAFDHAIEVDKEAEEWLSKIFMLEAIIILFHFINSLFMDGSLGLRFTFFSRVDDANAVRPSL
jgi:hypothetical protein